MTQNLLEDVFSEDLIFSHPQLKIDVNRKIATFVVKSMCDKNRVLTKTTVKISLYDIFSGTHMALKLY